MAMSIQEFIPVSIYQMNGVHITQRISEKRTVGKSGSIGEVEIISQKLTGCHAFRKKGILGKRQQVQKDFANIVAMRRLCIWWHKGHAKPLNYRTEICIGTWMQGISWLFKWSPAQRLVLSVTSRMWPASHLHLIHSHARYTRKERIRWHYRKSKYGDKIQDSLNKWIDEQKAFVPSWILSNIKAWPHSRKVFEVITMFSQGYR